MPLTADEIRIQAFTTAPHGYDPGQVRAFLDRIASDYAQALDSADNGDASARMAARMLQAAADSAAQLLSETETEADALRRAAKADAQATRSEAAAAADKLDRAAELLEAAHRLVTARVAEMERRMRVAEVAVKRAKVSMERSSPGWRQASALASRWRDTGRVTRRTCHRYERCRTRVWGTQRLGGRMTRFGRFVVVGLVVALVASFAPASLAKDGDVIRRGGCSGRSDWKLKLSPENGRIEVEFEVDQNKSGVRWRVALKHDGKRFTRTTRVTGGRSGSFEVRRVRPNHGGKDFFRAVAHNLRSGAVCRGRASF